MQLSPDQTILWEWGPVRINATLALTWAIMALLVTGSWAVTRRSRTGAPRGRWQHLLEMVVLGVLDQVREVGLPVPRRYIAFLGTLFLFIGASVLLTVVPGYEPPTASLSTTVALALCVFVSVPFHGIRDRGLRGYLHTYLEPTPFMLPFNIIGELSRTLALAVRLFGNLMSGSIIIAILLSITPFLFPVVMSLLGLLTGMVQAYIFSILAAVYIAAAMRDRDGPGRADAPPSETTYNA